MHINIRSYGIIMLLMIAMIACRSVPVSEASYPQADKKLAEFDKENPDCQLWTNWQKMCSRTGENGATWCTTDPDHPVEPSEPFCVQNGNPIYTRSFLPLQTESAMRYCLEEGDIGLNSLSLDELGKPQLTQVSATGCITFDENRPFNGTQLASRRHPWCKAWSNIKNGAVVFREKEGVFNNSRYKYKIKKEFGLFCSDWVNISERCIQVRDSATAPRFKCGVTRDQVCIPDFRGWLENIEVIGVYCVKKGSK